MKNLTFTLLIAASCLASCQHEKPSEVEQKRQKLEAKRQELKEKQELNALQEEMKKVEQEIEKTDGKTSVASASYKASNTSPQGRIVGDRVILRSAATTQSDKLGNFVNNETVTILDRTSNSTPQESWFQVRRVNGQTGWVFGEFLMEL